MSPTTHQREVRQQPLKVAHILIGSHKWGVESYVENLVAASDNSELSFVLICTKQALFDRLNGRYEAVFLPINGYLDLAAIPRMVALVRKLDIDLIHCHLGLDSHIAALAGLFAGKPVVMSVHFDDPAYTTRPFIVRTFWRAIQTIKNLLIAHFLPITTRVAEKLTQREGVPSSKITVVHPGVPWLAIIEPATNREVIREQLSACPDDCLCLAVGRLETEKGFETLLEAASLLSQKPGHQIKIIIAGEGSQREVLTQLVSKGLDNTVRLLGYRDDIQNLLCASDIFILPAHAEPFGMAAVEAMMAGLPVIGTMGTGLATIVQDDKTGYLVPPGNADQLAQAICRLADSPQIRTTFGNAGKERAKACFTSNTMYTAVRNIYKMLVIR